ncbi:hypothetical protein CDD82_1971 [Ophiocordyceps australis]|uniref:GH16 domain-containing protein n=1 Tax=Ophiocordyceps australis TaxID=1399860 RepID=A0A2C5Y658_9HYPO|nr:hypothetical protein CDD82_1971 [Ophiocordyceps australis]
MQIQVVLVVLVASTGVAAAAQCECGFLIEGEEGQGGPWIFNEAVESAFGRIKDIGDDERWVRQEFDVSAVAGRGKYGKAFRVDKVQIGSGGVELGVGSELVQDDAVPVGELDSARADLHWGSYRAGIKLTAVPGTCSAFFWYFNDTQEIDMEFLSHEYSAQTRQWPVNLVVQSRKSQEAGYDAQKTGLFRRIMLGFDPTTAFHEYRFDYLADRVVFYADGNKLAEMVAGGDMPTSSGHLVLQHWSNGNPLWSGGPPREDALMTVSYVKAYFNSTTSKAGRQACASDAVCRVEDVTAANASTGGAFLTDDGRRGGSRSGHEDESGATRQDVVATVLLLTCMGVVLVSM